MATDYPIEITDPDGSVRIAGLADFIDPDNQPGVVTTSETVGFGGAAPSDGSTVNATWSHSSGAHLLDYTDPTAPTVIAAGIYLITGDAVMAVAVAATGAQIFLLGINGGFGNESTSPLDYLNLADDSDAPAVPVVFTAYLDAGTALGLTARQTSGDDQSIAGGAWIQYLPAVNGNSD